MMSPNRRNVFWFFLKLIAFYVILAWPADFIVQGYSRVFANCFDFLAHGMWSDEAIFGSDGQVRVFSNYSEDQERDIHILAYNRATNEGATHPRTSSRHLGYMPAAILASLILASPTPWKRRIVPMIVGMILVHLFVVFRFAYFLAAIFHGDNKYSLFKLEGFWERAFDEGFRLVAVVPASIYIVPLVIWLAVTFRKEDWDLLMAGNSHAIDSDTIDKHPAA